MCYNEKVSIALTIIGYVATLWIYIRTRNSKVAAGLAFLFALELIQTVQYVFASEQLPDLLTCSINIHRTKFASSCDTYTNKVFSLLSFLHFCFQPLFTHMINAGLAKDYLQRVYFRITQRFCILGGFLLFMRYFLSFSPMYNSLLFQNSTNIIGTITSSLNAEWFRGHLLCSFSRSTSHPVSFPFIGELKNLGTSIPLADPSYFLPSTSSHSFLLYAPYLLDFNGSMTMIGRLVVLAGVGPMLSFVWPGSNHEEGNWFCLFSLSQLLIVVVTLRRQLFSSAPESQLLGANSNNSTKLE